MERLMRMLKGLTACVALVGAFALTTLTTYANTSVSIKLAVDNGFYLFATDPNTNQLVLVGQGYDYDQVFTFNFTTVPYSYIYLMARDDGVAALFTAKTVFNNGAETVITGVSSSTWFDWEVNTIYKVAECVQHSSKRCAELGRRLASPCRGELSKLHRGQLSCLWQLHGRRAFHLGAAWWWNPDRLSRLHGRGHGAVPPAGAA
jgi:hypothetical protein